MVRHNPFTLAGKQILITGASSGIGRAIAIACAQMGASIIITGRNLARLNETLDACNNGIEHKLIVADLTVMSDVENLISQIPKLDGFVQCAGIGSRVFCKAVKKKDIDYIIKPNLEAPILLQSEMLRKKKLNKGASIVFVASAAASIPVIGNAIYSASKGAIISYAKCLALELAPRQIRVNCVCPAMIWTDLILQEGTTKEELEEKQLKYPLKRYGKPEDVAYLTIYLLSDAASWMTGSSIDLTGGTLEL